MAQGDQRFSKNTITGPGVTKFGPAAADTAYKTAVLFTLNEGLDGPSLTKTGPITAQDLKPSKAAMTPKAFAALKAYADKANTGDKKALYQVFYFATKDLVGGSGLAYRNDTAPVVSRKSFGSAPGATVYGQNLSLRFKAETDYRLLNEKKQPVIAHLKRDVTYSMKNVGGNWLIDGWTISQTAATYTNG